MTMEDFKAAIIAGDKDLASKLVDDLLEDGKDPQSIIALGITPAMNVVGERYARQDFFLPDMLAAADAAQSVLDVVEPQLRDGDSEVSFFVVVATVSGDQQEIGKNSVYMVFRAEGFQVTDLGTDVNEQDIVEAAQEVGADVVALSALLTTTVDEFAVVTEAFEAAGIRDDVLIVVGGAPVTESVATEKGADLYGETPFSAVRQIREALQIA